MVKHSRFAGAFLCIIITLPLAPMAPLAAQEKKPAKGLKHMEVDVGNGVKMKLVYIEPGKFMMGSPKEEKDREDNELQHEVILTKGFWMGVFVVTQEEYGRVNSKSSKARLPVDIVNWNEAMNFCKRLSKDGKTFDLPTEAEWEYACRAGTTTAFHYGNSLSSKQAHFNGKLPYGGADIGRKAKWSTEVGTYEPNAFGLYDMHGNVDHWCKDRYQAN